MHYAKQTPTICYTDMGESLITAIKPRCIDTKIHEVRETAEEANRLKLKKSEGPDMGTYGAPAAKDYQENKTGFSGKISPSPFVKFH